MQRQPEGTSGAPPSPFQERRVFTVAGLAVLVGAIGAAAAAALVSVISLISNVCFYGRLSPWLVPPTGNHLGWWVIAIPTAGGLLVGCIARWGSPAIRGHGIPEAMEQVLANESRISPLLVLLKPLSAALAIGTGEPFGSEGPIVASGGALGSLLGQVLKTSAQERKILLAAGAAAGLAAVFGTPVGAMLLAVELLLFEFRPLSIIAVSLASATAMALRLAFVGFSPAFPLPGLPSPTPGAMVYYVLIGALVGLIAVGVTKSVHLAEEAFEKLPFHFMWWPAIGGLIVGLIGYFCPATLGTGHENIEHIFSGQVVGLALLFLGGMKFLSWTLCLGSGTSGGTLTPMFTMGAAAGALLTHLFPWAGLDPRVGAMIGMAAIFGGASRALLASVVFVFESTMQPAGLLPLLAGTTAAYFVSYLTMRHTIMTATLVRRGVRVPEGYVPDHLEHVHVGQVAVKPVASLPASMLVDEAHAWLLSRPVEQWHQGYPILDAANKLVGLLTRKDILRSGHLPGLNLAGLIRRPPVVIYDDCSLRQASEYMIQEGVGRLPVVRRAAPTEMIGILTRSDLLQAHDGRARNPAEKASAPSPLGAPQPGQP